MIYKLSQKIRPRKRILGLFIAPSNTDENGARTDCETAPVERPEFPTRPETCPRFQIGHPPHGAQEARQRVFIVPEGCDTGSSHKNATAGRWQAGVDRFHGAAMVVCFVLADAWEKPSAHCRGLPQVLASIDSGTLTR